MFYIYILYSLASDKYYIGYSNNAHRRLIEHNSKQINSFTSKHRPWILKALFSVGEIEKDAVRIERFLKKQKSRKLIEKLCDKSFIPSGDLAQMVRVPHMRD